MRLFSAHSCTNLLSLILTLSLSLFLFATPSLSLSRLSRNYASPAQFDAPDYGTYVREFVAQVKPNMLSVDHYPDFDEDTPRSNKTKSG